MEDFFFAYIINYDVTNTLKENEQCSATLAFHYQHWREQKWHLGIKNQHKTGDNPAARTHPPGNWGLTLFSFWMKASKEVQYFTTFPPKPHCPLSHSDLEISHWLKMKSYAWRDSLWRDLYLVGLEVWAFWGGFEEEERSPSFFGVNAKMAEVGNGAVR